jgi:hypothetical protein
MCHMHYPELAAMAGLAECRLWVVVRVLARAPGRRQHHRHALAVLRTAAIAAALPELRCQPAA